MESNDALIVFEARIKQTWHDPSKIAEVGYERMHEKEDPELAKDRVKEYYELKVYPEDLD